MALSFVCVCVLFCAGAFQDLGGVGREAFPMGERPEGGTRPTQQRGETIETKPVTKPVCTTRPCFSVLACTVLVQYLYSTCTVSTTRAEDAVRVACVLTLCGGPTAPHDISGTHRNETHQIARRLQRGRRMT